MSFQKLHDKHYAATLRYAEITYNIRDDLAEQIVNDAFLDLYRTLKRGIQVEFPISFLRNQVKIQIVNYMRSKCRLSHNGLTKIKLSNANLCVKHNDFDAIDAKDAVDAVWTQLTKIEQKIATLIFMHDHTQREVATQFGLSLRTIERYVRRLKRKLRGLLTPI